MNAAAYLRVSSRAQTAAMQRDAIERAAATRGDEIKLEYVETLGGGTLARPQLQQMLTHVRQGYIRRLYVWALDRLTRSGIRDTLDVVDQLRRHGCEIVSVVDGFDLAGPGAEIILAVMAWAAKAERTRINERISAARDRAEREGRHWGRPRRMGVAEAARARALAKAGRSVRAIAIALKIPRATVARAVSKHRGSPTVAGPGKAGPPALASR